MLKKAEKQKSNVVAVVKKTSVPKVKNDIFHKILPDGTILVLKGRNFFQIAGKSVELYLAIDGKRSTAGIYSLLAKKYRMTSAEISKVGDLVLLALQEHGVIKLNSRSQPARR